MKNIPLAKKMLLGFGTVILMILLILTVSMVTSITRNSDLEKSNLLSDLLRQSNVMMDEFNLARIEIRSVFTSIDTAAEYDIAMGHLATCETHVETMKNTSAQLDGYRINDIDLLYTMFEDVKHSLTVVENNDIHIADRVATMIENGTLMTNSTSELSDVILSTIIGSEHPTSAVLNSDLLPVLELKELVHALRLQSRPLMLQQDISNASDIQNTGAQILEKLTQIDGFLLSDRTKTASSDLREEIHIYLDSVSEVVQTIHNSDREIALAREEFDLLNEKVAGFVSATQNDVTSMNNNVMTTSQVIMFVILAVGLIATVFSIFIAIYLSSSITRPLLKMKNLMVQAGETGNLVFKEEVRNDILQEATAQDEIGQSLGAFANFVDRMVYSANCLKTVSEGDLSIKIDTLGEQDTMGNALSAMLTNLNHIFSEINTIAAQVSTSSNEVAVGAQSLAQGSTEQAATVQEISASITEINKQMSSSTEAAVSAAAFGSEIGKIANQGNEKMIHMSAAMNEINDASQAIGRVIKAIDDIAFQTNILALNAAVEAARAGQHGKGFAVVADEVRNLAAKSAEAAKETSELISTNIVKTELGLRYTQETAETLEKIIGGIEQTNASLTHLAEECQQTRNATKQVTTAVDQVSIVIQQNSATSEQSAAASEEMSGQAQVLQSEIAQFKLRPTGLQDSPAVFAPKKDGSKHDSVGGSACVGDGKY